MPIEQFNALIQKGIDHLDYMAEMVRQTDAICKDCEEGRDTP